MATPQSPDGTLFATVTWEHHPGLEPKAQAMVSPSPEVLKTQNTVAMATALLPSKAKHCLSGADASTQGRGALILVACVAKSVPGPAGLEAEDAECG